MVKIKNKKRLKWALRQYENGKEEQKYLAEVLGITARRFRQIYSEYKIKNEVPMIGKNLGRPKKKIPESYETVILEKYERYRLNALYLEKVIYAENHVRIPHNTIHKVLKKHGLAKE